jgi:hypothetical protein
LGFFSCLTDTPFPQARSRTCSDALKCSPKIHTPTVVLISSERNPPHTRRWRESTHSSALLPSQRKEPSGSGRPAQSTYVAQCRSPIHGTHALPVHTNALQSSTLGATTTMASGSNPRRFSLSLTSASGGPDRGKLPSSLAPPPPSPPSRARVPRGDGLARRVAARSLPRHAVAARAVEALAGQQAAAVLWASDTLPVDGDLRFPHFPYVPTQLVSADPSQALNDPGSLVHPDDQVRCVLVPGDFFFLNENHPPPHRHTFFSSPTCPPRPPRPRHSHRPCTGGAVPLILNRSLSIFLSFPSKIVCMSLFACRSMTRIPAVWFTANASSSSASCSVSCVPYHFQMPFPRVTSSSRCGLRE